MGGAFKSMYSQKEFRQKYVAMRRIVSVFQFFIAQKSYTRQIYFLNIFKVTCITQHLTQHHAILPGNFQPLRGPNGRGHF